MIVLFVVLFQNTFGEGTYSIRSLRILNEKAIQVLSVIFSNYGSALLWIWLSNKYTYVCMLATRLFDFESKS